MKDNFLNIYDTSLVKAAINTKNFADEFSKMITPKLDFDDIMDISEKKENVIDNNYETNNAAKQDDENIKIMYDKDNENNKKYELRVSPFEVLTFDNGKDYIDKIGELLAEEIRQASKNRSAADAYFKPGVF